MRENYIDLCCFNFGKRSYVIMKNSVKIMFFEKVNDNYEMPILSFDLYDNVGKSLTVVNQNFFMSQLINRLNIAFNKGILSSDKEIRDFLNNIKLKVENDVYLKKLFKGSLMNKIDEQNYESNKREIIKYLDQFKIDMFVNYNNVSIFNGTLDKNTNEEISTFNLETDNAQNVEVIDNSISDNLGNSFDFSKDIQESSIDDVSSVHDDFTSKNVDSTDIDNISTVQNIQDINVDNSFDSFINGQSVSVDETSAVNSNDYFSSLGSNESVSNVVQDNASVQNNISYVDEVRKRLENNF